MLTEWILWFRRRGIATSRRALASVVLLGGFVLIAIVILLFSSHRADIPTASTPPPAAAPVPGEALSGLRASANDSDVWSTRLQRARKWQVAKMEAVSRLLKAFPAVADATVLLEPGREAKLGCPGTKAKAAVHLVLAPDATMTPGLLRAVIDQTAGCMSDLSAEDVRVILSAGRSYTLADVQTLPPDPRVLLRAERRYREKIQSALSYIKKLTLVVEVVARDGDIHCGQVMLSLPVSHAEAIYRRSGSADGGPKEAILDGIMRAEAARIRGIGATVAGAPMDHVVVEWHHDAFPEPPARFQHGDVRRVAWMVLIVGVLACAEAGVIAGIVIRRVRRRRRRQAWARVRAIGQRRRTRATLPDAPAPAFDAILQADLDDLVTLLRVEEPQTVAMVLSHLSPARAAKVLAGINTGKQADVARQIAELHEADPQTLRMAKQKLTRRWVDRETARPVGGVAAVARILQYTGQAGRKNVLETLRQHQPDFAERISRRLLCFEDLAGMDPDRLAGALGDLSGEELALALWTADKTVPPPLINALSPAQREAMEQASEQMGPVRLSQVKSAQQHIVDVVREFEAGRLAWASAGKDEQLA